MKPVALSDKKIIAIDSQLKLFKEFGIKEPPTEKHIHVEKQPLKGCTVGTYFEYPPLTSSAKNELFIPEKFANRVLTKLSACVGVGIYSMKLSYSDGTDSPLFGSKEPNQIIEIAT